MAAGPSVHYEAIRYLASLDVDFEIDALVHALENDDPGVRWEAGILLARLGRKAVPAILKALMDPKRVGDPRLRTSVVHVIHSLRERTLQTQLKPLIKAMKDVAPDLKTMQEAARLLNSIKTEEALKNQKD
jgi:HEAT repeat protein